MTEAAKKLHHHLIAGQITFQVRDAKGEITGVNQANLNAVVTGAKKEFPVRMIGKAQQALQLHFHKKIGQDAPVEVVDVVLMSVSYLGHMTEAEFHAVPDGKGIQEKAKPDLSVVRTNDAAANQGKEHPPAEDRDIQFPESDTLQ